MKTYSGNPGKEGATNEMSLKINFKLYKSPWPTTKLCVYTREPVVALSWKNRAENLAATHNGRDSLEFDPSQVNIINASVFASYHSQCP